MVLVRGVSLPDLGLTRGRLEVPSVVSVRKATLREARRVPQRLRRAGAEARLPGLLQPGWELVLGGSARPGPLRGWRDCHEIGCASASQRMRKKKQDHSHSFPAAE
jgi:hypothetical protein